MTRNRRLRALEGKHHDAKPRYSRKGRAAQQDFAFERSALAAIGITGEAADAVIERAWPGASRRK